MVEKEGKNVFFYSSHSIFNIAKGQLGKEEIKALL
jgi:hypothetical protein